MFGAFYEFDRFNGPPPLRPLAKPPSRITNFQNSPLLTSQDANVRAYLIYENFVLLTTVLYHIFPLFTAINPTSHWLGFLLGIPQRSQTNPLGWSRTVIAGTLR